MSRRLFTVFLALMALGLGACATAPTCTPVEIVVAAKEQRTRLRTEPGGLQTSQTGQVREIQRETFVREYWLKDAQGRWDQVTETAWKAAEVGRPAEVCRPRP